MKQLIPWISTLTALTTLSLAHNATLNRWPRLPGVTGLQTAAGVAYTVIAAAWLLDRRHPWRPLTILLACFATAGLPMLLGDIRKDTRKK